MRQVLQEEIERSGVSNMDIDTEQQQQQQQDAKADEAAEKAEKARKAAEQVRLLSPYRYEHRLCTGLSLMLMHNLCISP